MKYSLVLLVLIFFSLSSYSQFSLSPRDLQNPKTIVVDIRPVYSKMDTTVLFKGIDTAFHLHVYVSDAGPDYTDFTGFITTLEYRNCGGLGCPEDWLNENQICELCLKHINIKETRWYEDRYKNALDRLNKLKKQ